MIVICLNDLPIISYYINYNNLLIEISPIFVPKQINIKLIGDKKSKTDFRRKII